MCQILDPLAKAFVESDAEKALADLKEKAASVVDAVEKGNADLYLKFAQKGLEKVSEVFRTGCVPCPGSFQCLSLHIWGAPFLYSPGGIGGRWMVAGKAERGVWKTGGKGWVAPLKNLISGRSLGRGVIHVDSCANMAT